MNNLSLPKNSLNFNKDFLDPYIENMRKEIAIANIEWIEETKKILESLSNEIRKDLPMSFSKKMIIRKHGFSISNQKCYSSLYCGGVWLTLRHSSIGKVTIGIKTDGVTSIVFMINNNIAKEIEFRAKNSETLKKRTRKELRDYLKTKCTSV